MAHAHSAQYCQGKLRSDSADVVDEQTKKIALGGRHESIKNVRVFAHVKMGKDLQGLAGRREFVVARQGNENLVANARHVDDRLRWQSRDQLALKKGNHLPQSLTDRLQTATGVVAGISDPG